MSRTGLCTPITRSKRDYPKLLFGAVGDTLLEVAVDPPHLVGYMGEAKYRLGAGLGEGVEGRCFDLDRKNSGGPCRLDRRAGLPKGRVRGSTGAGYRCDAGSAKGLLGYPNHPAVRFAIVGRRQVMVASAFVAERPIDDHEIGGLAQGENLACRRDADKKATARGEKLPGHKNGKRAAADAADNATFIFFMIEGMKNRVIAGPSGVEPGAPRCDRLAHDVAVWIEYANLGNRRKRETFLPPRLSQETFRGELRGCRDILVAQDWR